MLQMMARNDSFDLLIAMMTEDAPAGKEGLTLMFRDQVKNYIRVKEESSKPLLGVVGEKSPGIENHNHWRWRALSEARTKLLTADIPIYPTVGRAARAARRLIDYYQKRR